MNGQKTFLSTSARSSSTNKSDKSFNIYTQKWNGNDAGRRHSEVFVDEFNNQHLERVKKTSVCVFCVCKMTNDK